MTPTQTDETEGQGVHAERRQRFVALATTDPDRSVRPVDGEPVLPPLNLDRRAVIAGSAMTIATLPCFGFSVTTADDLVAGLSGLGHTRDALTTATATMPTATPTTSSSAGGR